MSRSLLVGVLVVVVLAFVFLRIRRAGGRAATPPPAPTRAPAGRVSIDDTGVSHHLASGEAEQLRWEDIARVHIETAAGGLNADDVTWVLSTVAGTPVVRVAQTAPGADALLARLQQLPGFRYETMIGSMITTEATHFVVWERAAP
ncbi:MAG TPA: hypothetical protein VFX50_10660 [Gemmatimonadales bacterium]|nr:hypothetical protein [Gemmatimonadales bacterium]